MRNGTKLYLICDGKVVSGHGDGGKHYGWSNPIDIIPPVGSIIEYMTFNQGTKEGEGILTSYIVKGYIFTTEEDFNSSYCNKTCKIIVDKCM